MNVSLRALTLGLALAGGSLPLTQCANSPATNINAAGVNRSQLASDSRAALKNLYANNPAAGGDIVTSVGYHNTATGKKVRQVSLYYASASLDPPKTVRYLTLPNISQGVNAAQTSLHIFTTAIG